MVPDFNFNQNRFLSALALESSFSANKRRRFGKVTSVCLFFTLVFIAAGYLSAEITKNYGINNSALNNLIYLFRGDAWVGLFFILLAFRLFIFSLDAFFRSKTLGKNGFPSSKNIAQRLNFRSSEIWHECVFNKDESERNLLPGILKTDIGKLILIRSGIYPEEFRALTSKKASDLKIADEVIFELEKITKDEKGINSADLFSALYNCDKLFREFLAFKKISSHDLQSAAMWAEEELDEADMKSRWWLIENLFRVGGLAKDWAYGEAYFLENFAQELRPSKIRKEELIGKEKERGHNAKVVIESLKYNQDDSIDIDPARLLINYNLDNATLDLRKLTQTFEIRGELKIKLIYSAKTDKTQVITKVKGQGKVKEELSGIRILKLTTENGTLNYSY